MKGVLATTLSILLKLAHSVAIIILVTIVII